MSNVNYFMGIDSGSTMCKTVLMQGDKIIDTQFIKTGWNPQLSAKESMESLLKKHSLDADRVCITATGYGRDAVDFAHHTFTEITCHAFGAMHLASGIQGVIDIGGQDSKVIQIQDNRVVNFLMNDKCAAGTGRFLSMASETLGVSLEDLDEFVHPSEAIPINSMCTVFAESEIIGLLAMQKDRTKILAGVLQSIAHRIKQMVSKIDFTYDAPLLMTGGLSRSKALVKAISQAAELKVISHEQALFAGAIGACLRTNKR